MSSKTKQAKGNPADLRVRNIIFSDTAGELPRLVDGPDNPVYLRVTLPCHVEVPLGLSVRYPDFDFAESAMVTLYGGAREFAKDKKELVR